MTKLAAAKRGETAIGDAITVDAWFNQWLTTCKEPKAMTPKSLGMLAFASVYATGPVIFVLDEPTANLDEDALLEIKIAPPKKIVLYNSGQFAGPVVK